jgi:thiamine-monophosphate kinase
VDTDGRPVIGDHDRYVDRRHAFSSRLDGLADIAAMGALPLLATITLALTGDERVSDLEELYRGAATLAEPHGVAIVGGDIVRTTGPVMLAVTAIGEAANVLQREGARPGDRLIVSGTLGASAAGMRLLQMPDLRARATTAELLIAAHLRPNPRVALGHVLATHGATSAMDLSDGLLGDLPKMLAAGGVAARVNSSRVPVLPAVRALFPEDWLELALRGGDDYELLATIPPDAMDEVGCAAANVGATITDIGEILAREDGEPLLSLIDANRDIREVPAGAFDHFG